MELPSFMKIEIFKIYCESFFLTNIFFSKYYVSFNESTITKYTKRLSQFEWNQQLDDN